MPRAFRAFLLVATGVLAVTPAARADPLIIPAPGAKNLTAGGGWRAWAAPKTGGRWQLMTRAPDGTIQPAGIEDFEAPPDPSIGSTALAAPAKRVVAVYSRCKGSSATKGCDVFQYDLAAGTERKVIRISTIASSETAPSISAGSYAFARSGGPDAGTYTATRSHVRRIYSRVARETALTPSRVAFRSANGIMLSQLDGRRRRTITTDLSIFSVVITRYRVGWLQRAGHRTQAFMTDRINPSGKVTIRAGAHDLPASTQSAVADSSRIVEYLGATGIKRADPPLFP
jgi:hypothetical protein